MANGPNNQEDLSRLAQTLQKMTNPRFKRDNTTYSNETKQRLGQGPIADLEDELPSLLKTFREARRKMDHIFKGGQFEKQSERFYSAIEDAAKTLEQANRSFGANLARQYKAAMKASEGDYKRQQEISNTLEQYHEQVKIMLEMQERFQKADEEQKLKMLEAMVNQRDSVNEIASQLTEYGIRVERITEVTEETVSVLSQHNDTLSVLTRDTDVYVNQLKEHYGAELKARQEFSTALVAGIGDMTNKIFGTIESRLRAFQTQTRFVDAAMRGLSPQEFSEWLQANRQALVLQGDQAAQDAIYSQVSAELKKYGIIGKDAAAQVSFLSGTLMQSGASASAINQQTLQNSIAQLQYMTGMDLQSANQMASQMLTSAEVMAMTFDKGEAERRSIQQEQLTELTRISLTTGYSADYMFEMLKEQRAVKYKDVVSQITQGVMLDVALNEYERMTGKTVTAEQREVVRKGTLGGLERLSPEEAALFLQTKREMGSEFERLQTSTVSDVFGGRYGSAAKIAPLQTTLAGAGINMQEWATSGMMAAQREVTTGRAVSRMDVAGEVIKAMQSLSSIEATYLNIKEVAQGAAASPAGGLLGSVFSFGKDILAALIAHRLGKALFGKGGFKGLGDMFRGLMSKIGIGGGPRGGPPSPGGPSRRINLADGGRPRGGKPPMRWGNNKLGWAMGIGTMLMGGSAFANDGRGEVAEPGGLTNSQMVASQSGFQWANAGLTAALGAPQAVSAVKNAGGISSMLAQARGMATLGNAGALIKGGLKRFGPVGAIFGAIRGIQTETEDYRQMFGFGEYDTNDGPFERAFKDVGVRTLGVLNDVLTESTFGLVDFANREAVAMASGATLDENGNIIPPGEDASVAALNRIVENTERTVDVIDQSRRDASIAEAQRRTESAYQIEQRKYAQNLAASRAAVLGDYDKAIGNAVSNATDALY